MNPKVTVLIPVFNRAQFVDEAIRSVMEQDFADFEIVLADDGSTDATPRVLESWRQRDPRVVVVTSPVNRGIPAALNLGLAHARGKYIARLDSDDLMMPRRLAEEAALLDARPDVAVASCYFEVVDLEGRHVRIWRGDEPHEVTLLLLNFFNSVGGPQTMFRRDDVIAEGGYSLDCPVSEDYEMFVRLLRRGRLETLPFVGVRKRTHADQSILRWAGERRVIWSRVMRSSLEPYLMRPVCDEEIDALITVWRDDGIPGRAALADSVMREAFARFCAAVPDRALRVIARKKIAHRWFIAGRIFRSRGHPAEAAKYLARAARWLLTPR